MGSARRKKPKNLGQKLKAVRNRLGHNFSEMAEELSDSEIIILRTDVSRFEKGLREPSIIILLRYARLAGISTDILIDDKIEFP